MKSLIVLGRRWFDRVNGNTYHTAEVYVDGELIGKSPITYGYDNAYQQTAMEMLVEKGLVSEADKDRPLWHLYRDGKVETLSSPVVDLTRKRDL